MIVRPWIVILIVLISGKLLAGFFYTDEIFINRNFSNGIKHNSNIYFITSCNMHRKPKGLARFPDGGQVKTVHGEIALYRYHINDNNLEKLSVISKELKIGTAVSHGKFKILDNDLIISYRCTNNFRGPMKAHCIYRYNLIQGKGNFPTITESIKIETTVFKDYWDLNRKKRIAISNIKKKLKTLMTVSKSKNCDL